MPGINSMSGSNHDWYTNPKTQISQAVPRYNEIDEHLAKAIIKALSKEV